MFLKSLSDSVNFNLWDKAIGSYYTNFDDAIALTCSAISRAALYEDDEF